MKAAVSVVQAVLILLVTISIVSIMLPWVSSSLETSSQTAEMGTVKAQMGTCNEKIEETSRTGSANSCIFSVGKGKLYAQADGIYYQITSSRGICDQSGWIEIDTTKHLWQKCDVDVKTQYTLMWSWPKDMKISGESMSGKIYRLENSIADIAFNDTVDFRTLTVFIQFEFIPGQTGTILEMSRASISDENVTLKVNIR
jgi:type II secretory pathway pseudopilin PulG